MILADLKSRNGTYVNSRPIGNQVLRNNDIISLGDFRIKVILPPSFGTGSTSAADATDTTKMMTIEDARRARKDEHLREVRVKRNEGFSQDNRDWFRNDGCGCYSGCGGGGGGDSSSETFGFLSLGISDAPIHDAQKVCVTFTDIELKPMGGPSTTLTLSSPEKINLLDFQGTNTMPILNNERLPAGQYEWMRLGVDAVRGSNGGVGDTGDAAVCDGDASYIVMNDNSVHNLYVPSGANTGLKLHGGYTVPANDQVSLTAEFDLGKSITAPPGQSPDVMLRPTIKLVNNNEVGTLTGQVANELAEAEACQPSVYVFNDGVMPNGFEDDVVDPG